MLFGKKEVFDTTDAVIDGFWVELLLRAVVIRSHMIQVCLSRYLLLIQREK